MVLILGCVAHALDLMVPEAFSKKLEPMNLLHVHVYFLTQARDGHTVCMAVQHGEGQYLLMNLADSGKVKFLSYSE